MNQIPLFQLAPLERVAEGMTVVDADGRRLGRVARVVMGDLNDWHRGPVTRGLRHEFTSPMRRMRPRAWRV